MLTGIPHRSPTTPPRMVLSCVAMALSLATAHPAFAAPGPDWPLYRSDLQLTRHNAGKGKLAAPVLRWRAFLGGRPGAPRALDADLDGIDDVLAIEAGAISARGWNGKVYWKTGPLGATQIVAVRNVNDDQTLEVVVRVAGGVSVLSATSGALLWSSPAGLYPHLHVVHVADFDGDGVADVAMADKGGSQSPANGAARVYRLTGKPALMMSTPEQIDGKKARGDVVRMVDMDGDGLPDVYIPLVASLTKGVAYAFSGKNGKLLGKSEEMDRLGCQLPTSLQQAKGPPLVLCSNTESQAVGTLSVRGAFLLTLQGNKIVRKWQHLVPDEQTDRFHAVFVGDVEGDDQIELVATEWVGGAWQVRILDALTGKSIGELAGSASWLGVTDLKATRTLRPGATGPGLILARAGGAGIDSADAGSRLISWTRTGGFAHFADLGKGVGATLQAGGDSASTPIARPGVASTFTVGAEGMDLLLRRDSDGDKRYDRVEVLHVGTGGQVSQGASADFGMLPLLSATLSSPVARHVLISTPDGQCAVMGAALKLLNDPDGDGDANLTYGAAATPRLIVARTHAADTTPRVLASEAGRLRVYDLKSASPTVPPAVDLDLGAGSDLVFGNLVDLDGDGARELVVRSRSDEGSGTLDAYKANGDKLWSYVHPGGALRWATRDGGLFGPIPAGKGHDLLIGLADPNVSPMLGGRVTLVDGTTGKSKWGPDAACSGFEAVPFAYDGTAQEPVAIFATYADRLRCRVSDGAVLAQTKHTVPRYGAPMLADLDEDGDQDVVLGGGYAGFGAERTPGHTPIWTIKGLEYYHRQTTLFPSGTKDLFAATLVSASPEVRVVDARTGKLTWKHRYAGGAIVPDNAPLAAPPVTSGLLSVADLVGDGTPSLLFTTSDGWLYAVAGLTGAIRWSSDWGGALGDPIAADLDGDGDVEILFSSPDGYLNALDHDVLGALAWVRENDGNGPATTADADIDQQERSDTLHLNWAPLPSAQGYAVQVASQDGAVIVPMTQVGAATAFTFDDLNLRLGLVYTSTVSAWVDGAAGKQYSVPTLSDGVTIVDLSPPDIAGLKAEPPVILAGGETLISALLTDLTRLSRVDVDVANSEGEIVTHWQRPLAVRQHALAWTWQAATEQGAPVAPGTYSVTVTTRDGAAHIAKFGVNVLVCAPHEQPGAGACLQAGEDAGEVVEDAGSADVGAPDAGTTGDGLSGGDGSGSATAEARVGGDEDSCCSASPTSNSAAPMLLLFALSALGLRRRRC